MLWAWPLCGPELTCDWAARVSVISDHHENIMCVCQEAENLQREMDNNPSHILARQWLKGTGMEKFPKLKPVPQVCLDGWFVASTPWEKEPENVCVLSRGQTESQAECSLGLFYGCIFCLGPWQEAPLSHNRTVQPNWVSVLIPKPLPPLNSQTFTTTLGGFRTTLVKK